jgi:hypothetical protein
MKLLEINKELSAPDPVPVVLPDVPDPYAEGAIEQSIWDKAKGSMGTAAGVTAGTIGGPALKWLADALIDFDPTPKTPQTYEEKINASGGDVRSFDLPLEEDPIGSSVLGIVPSSMAARAYTAAAGQALKASAKGALEGVVSVVSDATVIRPMLDPFREKYPTATLVADLVASVGIGMTAEDAIVNAGIRAARKGADNVIGIVRELQSGSPLTVSEQFFKDHAEILEYARKGDLHALDAVQAQIEKELRNVHYVGDKLDELFAPVKETAEAARRVELRTVTGDSLTAEESEALFRVATVTHAHGYVKEFQSEADAIVKARVDADYSRTLQHLESAAAAHGGFSKDALVEMLVRENPAWQVAARRAEKAQLKIAHDYAEALVAKVQKRFPQLVVDGKAAAVGPNRGLRDADELILAARAATENDTVRMTDLLADLATTARTRSELTAFWKESLRDDLNKHFKAEVSLRASEDEASYLARTTKHNARSALFEAADASKRARKRVVRGLLGSGTDLRAALRETLKQAAHDLKRAEKLKDATWTRTFRETVREAHVEYRANLMARQKVLAMISELRGHMGNRSVANAYHEQIYSWLYPHFNRQLSARVHTPSQDMYSFLVSRSKEHNDLGAKVLLDAYEPLFSMSRRTRIEDMTVEQLEQVTQFMRALTHVGRAQRVIRTEGQEILAGYVVRQFARTSNPLFKGRFKPKTPLEKLSPEQSSRFERYKEMADKLAPIEAGLQRMEYICQRLDGFESGGMAWKHIFDKANQAERLKERLHSDLLRTRYRGVWDRYRAETVTGDSLSRRMQDVVCEIHGAPVRREKALLAYMHLQGDDNAELVVRNLNQGQATPLDRGQLDTLLRASLDPADLKLCDDILNLMDETFPMLAKVHEELTGLTLQKVRGRYMPMRQAADTKRYADTSASFIDVILDTAHQGAPSEVRKHLLKTRHGGITELDLSFGSITQHLHDVVHVASHATMLHDINKIVSRADFKRLVDENLGSHVRKEMETWLQDLARPSYTETPFLKQLRQNVTVVTLGLKVITAAKQPLGALTAMSKVHPVRVAQGFATVMKRKFNQDDILAISKELPLRWSNRIRECAEASRVYDPFRKHGLQSSTAMRDAFMSFSNWMDQVTSEAVWRGAYAEGLEKYAQQPEAVVLASDYADSIIRMTQGSSSVKDMSRWLRSDNEGVRYLTMFQFYFNSFYNQLSELALRGQFDSRVSKGKAAATMLFLAAAPAAVQTLAGSAFDFMRGEKSDNVVTGFGRELALNAAGTVPVFRDLVSSAVTGFDYNVTPVSRAARSAVSLARLPFTKKRDQPMAWLKASSGTAGAAFGYPSDQFIITVEGAMRLLNHRTDDIFELIAKEEK